jgi:hypothetical protein
LFSSSCYKSSSPWVQEWRIASRAWARRAVRENRAFRRARAEIELSQKLLEGAVACKVVVVGEIKRSARGKFKICKI